MNDMKNPAAQEIEEQEIDLLALAHVLVRRKRLIMELCGAAAIIAVIFSLILPNIYSATAKVLPPQKESGGGLLSMMGQAGGLAGIAASMGLAGNADLYLGILKSRSVADAVISSLDLAKVFKSKTPDETRKTLEGAVRMQAGKDSIITITAESKDPKLAAALANAFVKELGRKSVQLNLTKAGTERAFLEKRIDIVKGDLKRAEEDLKSFQEKNKAIKVDTQAVAFIEGIAKLKAEIVSNEVQLASLKSYQTDENADVKALQAALAKLRSQLAGLSGSGSDANGFPTMGSAPSLGLEYARRMRELKTQEMIFEQLSKQNEIAKLTEAKDSSSIQILDEAVVPIKKSKPKRSLIVILTTVAAFFIATFTAFILEYFEKIPEEDRVRWEEIRRMLFPRKKRE